MINSKKAKDKMREQHDKFLSKNIHKLVTDFPSASYHGLTGTWSSSQFKDMLEDEDYFIKKYIKREIQKDESSAMDTGTYLHTRLLEPHKVKDEIAVYPGKVRMGKNWEAFRNLHAGKTLIIESQREQGEMMAKAVEASPTSMSYLEGKPEVSLFVRLVVWKGCIYAPEFGKKLTRDGWISVKTNGDLSKGYAITVKVRADTLGKTFISDLKSTSGNARKEHDIRSAISKYRYDLSAALYLDMFTLVVPDVREFVWVFASKQANNAAPWRASRDQIRVGRAKYMLAIIKLADCAQANWELVDCLREAEPLPYERDWLISKDTDLL
jgi:hypothetical protein